MNNAEPILVTGGTGYVGARLIPRLLEAGYKVRAIARSIDKLRSRSWANHPELELIQCDVFDFEALKKASEGCSIAYYLVHSMISSNSKFVEKDRLAAENMVRAAEHNNLKRIIYLGGLGSDGEPNLSKHLRSRIEVGEILKKSSIPVTILRAAMIIGSGSASFEILRYLVDRLPIMVTPRWVDTPCQPIAIRNVLNYLIGCIQSEETINKTFDIGGDEILNYRQLMRIYAEEAKLGKRIVFPIPVFTPKLSSYWIHIVTPVPSSIARPLAEGLQNPVICENNDIRQLITQEILPCREAIKLAIERVEMQQIESHWTDAGHLTPPEWVYSGDPEWAGGTIYQDCRKIVLKSTPAEIWNPLIRIGGKTGWYYGNWLWQLRGILDLLVGGVGLRRGRRHPSELRPGDALDFWRVLNVDINKHLILLAEMKLPGEAVLEFRVNDLGDGTVELQQIARFLPKGLGGILYWWAVTPLHHFVFNGMLRGIARASKKEVVSQPSRLTNNLQPSFS